MEFPKYVTGGLFLSGVHNGIATYRRPTRTGAWSLEASYQNEVLVCTYCLADHLIGKNLDPITEEEFEQDNGNFSADILINDTINQLKHCDE